MTTISFDFSNASNENASAPKQENSGNYLKHGKNQLVRVYSAKVGKPHGYDNSWINAELTGGTHKDATTKFDITFPTRKLGAGPNNAPFLKNEFVTAMTALGYDVSSDEKIFALVPKIFGSDKALQQLVGKAFLADVEDDRNKPTIGWEAGNYYARGPADKKTLLRENLVNPEGVVIVHSEKAKVQAELDGMGLTRNKLAYKKIYNFKKAEGVAQEAVVEEKKPEVVDEDWE